MPGFFITTNKGGFALVTALSARALADLIEDHQRQAGSRFIELPRPDGETVLVDAHEVVLIQPPAPGPGHLKPLARPTALTERPAQHVINLN